MPKINIIIVIVLCLISVGVGFFAANRTVYLDKTVPDNVERVDFSRYCGDHICGSGETVSNCPGDCNPAVCVPEGQEILNNGIQHCCEGLKIEEISIAPTPGTGKGIVEGNGDSRHYACVKEAILP